MVKIEMLGTKHLGSFREFIQLKLKLHQGGAVAEWSKALLVR